MEPPADPVNKRAVLTDRGRRHDEVLAAEREMNGWRPNHYAGTVVFALYLAFVAFILIRLVSPR